MALLPLRKLFLTSPNCFATMQVPVRNLMSKQLVYHEFGDPLSVVKFRETAVPKLGDLDVLVKMLAAPVNPADINTIQGSLSELPRLPHVPGDEGVGDVVEVGDKVTYVKPGQRVIISSRQQGTWSYYAVLNESDVHKIPPNIPLAEASMLAVAPVTAFRLLHDHKAKPLSDGQCIIQNGANSAVGQSVIQICKNMGVRTINIVSNHCGYESVKEHLLKIGATYVYTLEETEAYSCLSFQRPTLAINCLGGRYEEVMLRMLERCGDMVYYGGAYMLPAKECMRPDVQFHKFLLSEWNQNTTNVNRDYTYKKLQELMVMNKFIAPMYEPILLKDYGYALSNTCPVEALATFNYVFDFTLI